MQTRVPFGYKLYVQTTNVLVALFVMYTPRLKNKQKKKQRGEHAFWIGSAI